MKRARHRRRSTMKVFEGLKGIGMSEREARKFLMQSRSTLLLGTTNSDGTPIIHPVWYYFDAAKTKLYFYTEPALKKATNIKQRSQVYFDVDDDKWPYKGVKGKGRPLFRSALEKIKSGGYVVIEITPAYFTSWDFGKLERQTKSLRDSIIS
jgi:uncharacterized pyridoxamine 5'-phosphate oxidase family protein